jgi:hypothetical protein
VVRIKESSSVLVKYIVENERAFSARNFDSPKWLLNEIETQLLFHFYPQNRKFKNIAILEYILIFGVNVKVNFCSRESLPSQND